jgi:hypothetical protein
MPAAFGFTDWCRVGVTWSVSGCTVADGMPLEYLTDPQPRVRTRLIGASPVLIADLGALRTLRCVALLSTTLAEGATLTIRGSTADPTGADGSAFVIAAAADAASETFGAVIRPLTGDASARYIRFEMTAASGVLDIGNVSVMPLLVLRHGHGFGFVEGRLPTGLRDANPFTGAEFRLAGPVQPRFARFTLPTIRADEYAGTLRDMIAETDAASDVLWLPDIAATQAELNRRSLFGGIKVPGEEVGLERYAAFVARSSFRVVERV